MNNEDHQIEPLQLWLKNRCIWAEAHQKTLFYGLLIIITAIKVVALGLSGGFIALPVLLIGVVLTGLTGGLAASKNRNIWGWGLAGNFLFGIIILVFLRPLCGACLDPIPNAERSSDTCSRCGSKRSSRYA